MNEEKTPQPPEISEPSEEQTPVSVDEPEKTENSRFIRYCKSIPKRYFITAFSGMAQGLFVTLIAGTILAQIAEWIGDNYFGNTLMAIAKLAKSLMGAGIGVGIAHALGKNKMLVFSSAVAGLIGAWADQLIVGGGGMAVIGAKFGDGLPGNPIGAYVVTMLVVEIVQLYAGKTKLDILLIPLGSLLLAFVGVYVAYPFIWLINQLGNLIAIATNITPFVMGIVISVVMGILLTMPTSSAAIWVAVASPILTNAASTEVQINAMLLAGGAAAVGCACHMVGFAVTSFRENGVGGLISQGIGTSMLQIPNIMKKPAVMLPEIIASAICGPLSTCVFGLYCDETGGGMGTSGLVGVFNTVSSSANAGMNGWLIGFGVALLFFILPAAISLGVSEFMRKKGWIKFGDMKLDV